MGKYDFAKKKIMTPGPVPMPAKVRESLALYECHHRTAEFTEILLNCFRLLKKVFQTQEHCFLLSSTGTGAMEASLLNVLCHNSHLGFINAGKFGERWGKIAKAYGVHNSSFDVEWGRDIDLNQLEDFLKKQSVQALAFQACETSTGALLPVREIAELCQRYGVLSVVDGITALGAVHLPMDEWGVDVLLAGSQKAFMLPTGMAFVSLSARAQSVQSDLPKYYFDLKAEKKSNLDGATRYSTPTHLVIALEIVLQDIVETIGLQKHFQNIADKAQFFQSLVPLELFPKTPCPSLTCLKMPESKGAKALQKKVAEDGFIIMAGQDHLADQVLRVGHMGDISEQDLRATAVSILRHLPA